MSHKNVTDAEFSKSYHGSERPVVIDFWAPWCGPCNKLSPVFEKVANDLSGRADFVKINIDENPQLASSLGVRGIPSLFIMRGGNAVSNMVGVQPENVISDWIKENT